MCERSRVVALSVEGQLSPEWSDPEALETASVAAVDALLGHDVARVARVVGISRRELNKQRERERVRWLDRILITVHAVRARFGPERCAPVARMVARAAGYNLGGRIETSVEGALDEHDAMHLLAHALREVGEVATGIASASPGGMDTREAKSLLPEVDEAIQRLEAIRERLVLITMPRPSAPTARVSRSAADA